MKANELRFRAYSCRERINSRLYRPGQTERQRLSLLRVRDMAEGLYLRAVSRMEKGVSE